MPKHLPSQKLIAALAEYGFGDVLNIRRVVIDIRSDYTPVIHVEHYGDDRLINVVRNLEGIQITRTHTDRPIRADGCTCQWKDTSISPGDPSEIRGLADPNCPTHKEEVSQ